MNGRSYGYLLRALNELASLTARCRLKDVHRPVPAKVPVRIDGYRGNLLYGGAARDVEVASRHAGRRRRRHIGS
jgi:hypothetical protein